MRILKFTTTIAWILSIKHSASRMTDRPWFRHAPLRCHSERKENTVTHPMNGEFKRYCKLPPRSSMDNLHNLFSGSFCRGAGRHNGMENDRLALISSSTTFRTDSWMSLLYMFRNRLPSNIISIAWKTSLFVEGRKGIGRYIIHTPCYYSQTIGILLQNVKCILLIVYLFAVHLIRYCKMRKRRRDQDSEEIYFGCIRLDFFMFTWMNKQSFSELIATSLFNCCTTRFFKLSIAMSCTFTFPRFIRRVYNIQRRVVQFAEDISYPKTKKGRAMTWIQLLMNLIAIGNDATFVFILLSTAILSFSFFKDSTFHEYARLLMPTAYLSRSLIKARNS